MTQHASAWPDDKTAELVRLHNLGWSGPAIARALQSTKNSVNGKRKQLGLTRVKSSAEVSEEKSQVNRLRARVFDVTPIGPMSAEIKDFGHESGFTIIQTTMGCRWPVSGEGADMQFCCRPKAKGSFCTAHAARAYVTPPKPKQAPQRARRAA